MIQSNPYYPQSNGQAKSSNKILVNIIKRMVIDSPEKWHEKLGNTLWAYGTSKRAGTGTTPYALTFGQDAVLPMEINVSSVRIQNQFGLHSEEYIEAMCQGIEDLDVARIEALNQIQEGKRAVARAYNKKWCLNQFFVIFMNRTRSGDGLCGQDELGRRPLMRTVIKFDGETRLIKATSRRASYQKETV
ncbi:unnamed protein product [Malus baccata var. baccata]